MFLRNSNEPTRYALGQQLYYSDIEKARNFYILYIYIFCIYILYILHRSLDTHSMSLKMCECAGVNKKTQYFGKLGKLLEQYNAVNNAFKYL